MLVSDLRTSQFQTEKFKKPKTKSMRNLMITLGCFSMILLTGCNKRAGQVSSSSPVSVGLQGTFYGVKCNGDVGLCTVSKGGGGSGVLANRVSDTKIELVVIRNQISSADEMKITGNSISRKSGSATYPIEKDVVIDKEVAAALGLADGYLVIPKGNYQMRYDNNFITIEIQLVK